MAHLDQILGLYGFSEDQSHGLLDALDIVKCSVEIEESVDKALNALNEALQNCFLRPSGSERQQLNDKFKDEELRAQLIPLLSPFIQSIHTGDDISTKLLLGATENAAKERFKVLVDLENNGHHADTVYLLGGKRDLWIDYEPIATELVVQRLAKNIPIEAAEIEVKETINNFFPDKDNIGTKRAAIVKRFTDKGITWPTEGEMMERVAKNYENLQSSQFILVDAPMKMNDKGQVVRPDTLDTFNQLWKDHGEAISIAASDLPGGKFSMAIVTTQPYGMYQQQQAISAFYNKPVNIFVVADGISNPANMNIGTAFDTFARTIYAGKNIVMSKLLESKEEL